MMDYEGLMRASARAHAQTSAAPGAMGVVPTGRPDAPPLQRRQQHQQQQQQGAAREPQLLGGACYPVPMGMR